MSAFRCLLVFAGCLGLTACAITGDVPASPAAVPAGSRVTLEQPLQVPAGRARAYVQGGAEIQRDDVNRFIPYCYFRLRGNSDHPRARTIEPGDFETGPLRTRGGAAHGALRSRRVASTGWPLLLAQAQGGVARLTYVSEIPLHGASDARVERLVCAYDGEPTDGFLDLARIRTALRPIVSIQIP